MGIKKVALLGADGNLGPAVLTALLAHDFSVTILKRQSSQSPDHYPPHTTISRIPDNLDVEETAEVLRGQDALVITIKGSQTDVQKRLADACIPAGVQRLIPADFGSCDSSSPLTQALVPLYKHKTEFREYLQGLASKHPAFSWTSIVPGHFFDWDLSFIHVFPEERRMDFLDAGGKRFSISTLAQVGEATARALERPAETKNQVLFVQSFCVNQREILAAFEKASGEKWRVETYESGRWRDEYKAKADAGDAAAVEECVYYLGTVDADWTTRDGFAMEKLGMEDEDLDQVVAKVLESQQLRTSSPR